MRGAVRSALLFLGCATAQLIAHSSHAANPAAGSVSPTGPTSPFAGSWSGTATGSGATTEASCVEGTNCDTFRLTVAPGTYTGKAIQISLSWATASNNYDVYIHKAPNAGSTDAQANATAVIAKSTNAAPGTQERAFIDPVVHGDGDYTIHVVYLTASPADQYQASVALVAAAPEISATMTDSFPSHADGKAREGETIDYSVTITNSGSANAADVKFDNPAPANTTDVAGSLRMSALAINDSYNTNFNAPLSVPAPGVLANDKGIPAPTAVPINAGATSGGGAVTLNADGSFSYTPANGFGGADTFTYTATNVQPPNDSATVTIVVNNAPSDIALSANTVAENEPAGTDVGTLSTTDADPADTHTYSLVAGAGDTDNASFQINGATLETAASLNFEAQASYSVRVRSDDGRGGTVEKQFTVNVTDVNEAPTATDASDSTDEDTGKAITLAGTDPEGDTLTFTHDPASAQGGTITGSGASVTYTPALNFFGSDSFNFTVDDGNGHTDSGTITITVNSVNDAPVTQVDSYSTDEDTALSVPAPGVLANDTDVENSALTAILVAGPSNAAAFALNSDGSFSYTPAANFNGGDSFTYKANDGAADGNTVTVSLAVNAVNDAPVGVADDYSVSEDTALNVSTAAAGVLANDTDVEGPTLTASLVTGPAHAASFTLNSDGTFSYAPAANFFGPDSFTYKPNDGTVDGNATTVSLTITAANDAPTVDLDNTTAGDGSTATFSELVTHSGGAVPLAPNGEITDVDDTHLERLTVTLTNRPDGAAESLAANVSGTSITLVAYDSATGVLLLQGSDTKANYQKVLRTVTYDNTAAPPDATDRTITFVGNDGDADSPTATAVVTVVPLNIAPVLDLNGLVAPGLDSAAAFTEDSPAVAVAPAADVEDADDANLASATVTLTNRPDGGTESLSVDVSGTPITADAYVPSSGLLFLHGAATVAQYEQVLQKVKYNNSSNTPSTTNRTVTVKVNDGQADSNVANAVVSVTPTDDTPVAVNDSATVAEDAAATAVDVLANDTDVDGGPKSVSSVTQPTNGTVVITGGGSGVTYQPNANYCNNPPGSAADTFTYTLSPGTSTATVSVTVTCTNDPPSFTKGGNQTAAEDAGAQTVNAWATAISAGPGETDGLTFNVTNDNNALFAIQPAVSASGTLTYTPAANANGTATVSVTLTDDAGTPGVPGDDLTSAAQTFTITVTPVNDAPSFTPGANVSIDEDHGAYSQPAWATSITAGPADENSQGLHMQSTVTGTTGNLSFAQVPGVNVVTGDLKFQANANTCGTASVNVTLTDDAGTVGVPGDDLSSPTHVLTITVTCTNDTPTFTKGADQTVNEDSGAQTVNPWATAISAGPGESDALTFNVSNNNNPLFTAGGQPAVSATGVLTYTPAVNANGTAMVTVTLTDDAGTPGVPGDDLTTGPQTFNITVTAMNDAPSFTPGADVSVNEDHGLYNEAGWATSIRAGPPDEDSQGLSMSSNVTGTTGGLSFAQAPSVNVVTGNLRFQPNANTCGTASVQVTLTDDGGTIGVPADDLSAAHTFTITVNCINDPPTFTPGGNVTVNEDSGAYSAAWATAISAGPNETGAVTFAVANDNNALFATQPAIASNGTLTFTPATNAFGSATLTVSASDNGGTANGGDNTADDVTFTVTVNPVNDPPVAGTDSFETLGNTELQVDQSTGTTPKATETTASGRGVSNNDSDPVEGNPFVVTSIVGCGDATAPFDCTVSGQRIVMQADGKFSYTPAPGGTSGTFQYVITDDPNGVGSPATATGTVNITVHDMIWYVNGGAPAGGNGTSSSPYNSFAALNGAGGNGDVDGPSAYIFVHNSTVNGQLELEANQLLWGEGYGLSINRNLNANGAPTNLVNAGTKPTINGGSLDAVKVGAAGAAEIRGLTVSSTSGNAIDMTTGAALSGASTLLIDGNTFSGSGAETVDLNVSAGTSGSRTVTISNNTWSNTHAGNGIDSMISVAGVTLALNLQGNNIVSNGHGISVNSSAGASVIRNLSNTTINGNTAGSGIVIQNSTFDADAAAGIQTVAGGTTLIGGVANPVGASGIVLVNVQGSLAFTEFDIFNSSGTGLGVTGTGSGMTLTTNPSVSSIASTGGPAVDLTSVAATLNLAQLLSTNSTMTGVNLTTVTGTFSVNNSSSAINNATGIDFNVNGGSVSTTWPGTITDDLGQLVRIVSNSGTHTFTGAITDNDDGDGGISNEGSVHLATNTGTVTFSGGLLLNTGANHAFRASGGGTLSICAQNPCGSGSAVINKLTTTTANALYIDGTTIGTSNLTFRSISSNGGTNGIIVNNTGAAGSSGSFNITGTGVSPTGGTINAATDAGMILTNIGGGVHFDGINVSNGVHDGIRATGIVNFTMQDCTVTNNGSPPVSGERDRGLEWLNVSGTVTFANTTISGSNDTNAYLLNTSAAVTTLSVTGSTFTGSKGNAGLRIRGEGASQMTATITGNTFSANGDPGFSMQTDAVNTVRQTLVFDNNNVSGGSPTAVPGRPQISINVGGDSRVKARVTNNRVKSAAGAEIILNSGATSPATATFDVLCSNNLIGDDQPGALDPLADGGPGIWGWAHGDGVTRMEISNNTIKNWGVRGLELSHNDGNGTADYTVTGNTLSTPDQTANTFEGMYAFSGGLVDDLCNVCIDMKSNDFDGIGRQGVSDLALDRYYSSTLRFAGNNNATIAGLQAYLRSVNPASPALTVETFSNPQAATSATACALPQGIPPAPLIALPGEIETREANAGGFVSSAKNLIGRALLPALVAAAPLESHSAVASALTHDQLEPVVATAKARWESTGLSAEQVTVLRALQFEVADLEDAHVGETLGHRIRIDSDAAGYGWSVETTGVSDASTRRIDLLTTLMHEIGHALGLSDSYRAEDRDNVMYGYLPAGERRHLKHGQAARASLDGTTRPQFLTVGGVDIGTLPPGKSVTITYQNKINAPLPNGTSEISNQGTATGSNFTTVSTDDPATAATPNDPTITPVTAQADLAIAKTGPATFALGSNNTFTYTLTVTNNGLSANSGGFTVTDVLPTGTTFQSAGSTSGATVNGQTITYTNTTGLAANATQTFTIQVAVDPSTAGTTLQNSATVATNGTPDDTSSNNTSSVVSTAVTKSATSTAVSSSKNPSESGESVTFTATVTSANGTPTGTVQFKDNGGNIGGAQTLNGSGVATISGVLSTGAHTITAEYSGDANFNPSTGTLAGGQTVDPPPTPTPTATPTATATPGATASPSPTASPSGTPSARPVNISTRARVETDDRVLIAGTIITGNEPKRVMIRAIGPSLTEEGVTGVLANPVLALYSADGTLITQNDNWKDAQQSEIESTTLAPKDERESAIIATLDPNSYTAIVSGHNGTTGIALAEIYDLNRAADSKLSNISTRGRVATGENVMIGGFMLGGSPVDGNVIVRALGPSLGEAGLSNTLADPTLELRDANGTLVLENDNWDDDAAQAAKIDAAGVAPKNQLESAIALTLPRGDYTAIVAGKDGSSGVALVEIYSAP